MFLSEFGLIAIIALSAFCACLLCRFGPPATGRFYVLGKDDYTYEITRLRTPKNWVGGKYSWLASEYTMTQTTDSGYTLLRPVIHDSDGDGTPDAGILFHTGEYFLDPALKYTSTEITNNDTAWPDQVIEHFFKDIGVPESYISSVYLAIARLQYVLWNIRWVGGFYEQMPAEKRLSILLTMCNSYVTMTDKIELHPRSPASVLTVDKDSVVKDTFNYTPIWPSKSDGGYVEYVQGAGTPQTVTNKLVVPSDPTVDPDDVVSPESTTIRLTFKLIPTVAHLQLKPDQVITVSDDLYGVERDVLISSVSIDDNVGVSVEAIEFSTGIIDWDDCSPSSYSAGTDSEPVWTGVTETAPLADIKINTRDFDTVANGYAYIHGYDESGRAEDANCKLAQNGESLSIPRTEGTDNWTIATSQEYTGYIVHDTTLSGKFTVNSESKSTVFAKYQDSVWYYDTGSDWQDFSPNTATDVIVGELDRGAASITAAAMYPYIKPIANVVEKTNIVNSNYTATLSAESGSITLSSSNNTLAYNIINRQCTVQGMIKVDSISTPAPSGTLSINLPETPADLDDTSGTFFAMINVIDTGTDTAVVLFMTGNHSSDEANIGVQFDPGNVWDVADGIVPNMELYFNFTYLVEVSE